MTRSIFTSSHYLRTRGLWGNYGGPSSIGGIPTDQMDELFRQHDIAYLQGVKLQELFAADLRLIAQLQALDPAGLSPAADAYRRRAIRYFSRPISHIVGKPPDVVFGCRQHPGAIDVSDHQTGNK